jgi:hypothetical protein
MGTWSLSSNCYLTLGAFAGLLNSLGNETTCALVNGGSAKMIKE